MTLLMSSLLRMGCPWRFVLLTGTRRMEWGVMGGGDAQAAEREESS